MELPIDKLVAHDSGDYQGLVDGNQEREFGRKSHVHHTTDNWDTMTEKKRMQHINYTEGSIDQKDCHEIQSTSHIR